VRQNGWRGVQGGNAGRSFVVRWEDGWLKGSLARVLQVLQERGSGAILKRWDVYDDDYDSYDAHDSFGWSGSCGSDDY
jgi:hypothetical protein